MIQMHNGPSEVVVKCTTLRVVHDDDGMENKRKHWSGAKFEPES